MHKVKDGSSVNTISNISTPRRSMNMGSICSVMSNKSGSEFNKAIDISLNSGSALRRSSRVPKLINLESRDYESIAKPSVLKCNNSETDASIQSSIVLSIKNSCKLSQAASKKSAKISKNKSNIQKSKKPVLSKLSCTNSQAKIKRTRNNKTKVKHNSNNQTAVDSIDNSDKFTGKKRNKNSNSTISNAVSDKKSKVDSHPSNENTESCQGTHIEEKPKKKKVPVLPENEAIINSYVKYQAYFNETTLKTFPFKINTDKENPEDKQKSEGSVKGNFDECSLKLVENKDNKDSKDSLYNNKFTSPVISYKESNNKTDSNVSNLEICSNKTIQSETKLDFNLLKDLRCIKAMEKNLSVSEALTGNRTISTMASLDMDIINSITQNRSYSNNTKAKSRSQSKSKKPTIFNIVKTNSKKTTDKNKSRLHRKDFHMKSKFNHF